VCLNVLEHVQGGSRRRSRTCAGARAGRGGS
jgi:hypothetical protein